MAGSAATTRWAGRHGSASVWPRVPSGTCWLCRRTRRSVTWRRNRRPTGVVVRTPSRRLWAYVPGARRCRPKRGPGCRSAMERRDRWRSRSWPAAWSRRWSGTSLASRRRWWWCGMRRTENAYHLSNADRGTPLEEFARVAKAEHRIEECLKRGKSEAGLGDYQVRNWVGWHHHMTLSLLAAWFLVGETRRGNKAGAGYDAAPSPRRSGVDLSESVPMRYPDPQCTRTHALAGAQRTGAAVPLQGA